MDGQLRLSWSEAVWSLSGYRSMSVVSASFWHAAGTDASRHVPGSPSLIRGFARHCASARVSLASGLSTGCDRDIYPSRARVFRDGSQSTQRLDGQWPLVIWATRARHFA